MHITYDEAINTPATIVMRQLDYKSLENQVRNMKAEQQSAKS